MAKVSTGGLVTTLKQGTITVTATSGTVAGSTVLTVGAAKIVSPNVTPQTAAVSRGFTQQFVANGTF